MVLYNNDIKTPYRPGPPTCRPSASSGPATSEPDPTPAAQASTCWNNPNQMPHPSKRPSRAWWTTASVLSIPWYVRYYSGMNSQFVRVHNIDSYGHSNYHSLQTSYSHRFQDGLSSRPTTPGPPLSTTTRVRVVAGQLQPVRVRLVQPGLRPRIRRLRRAPHLQRQLHLRTPFGPGKWLGGTAEGWLAELIGGWQINGIIQANSGFPLDYKVPRDPPGHRLHQQPRPVPTQCGHVRDEHRHLLSLAPPRPTSPGPPASSTCTTRLVITTAASSAAALERRFLHVQGLQAAVVHRGGFQLQFRAGRSTCSTTQIITPIPT